MFTHWISKQFQTLKVASCQVLELTLSATLITAYFLTLQNQAYAQTKKRQAFEFQISKECLEQTKGKSGLEKINKDKFSGYNAKCDFEWALEEGNSLMQLFQDYASEKVKRFEKARTEKDTLTISRYYEARLCYAPESNKEFGIPGVHVKETEDECIARLKREQLEAQTAAREGTLVHNKTRGELVDERKNRLRGLGAEQESAKNSVLNDMFHASKLETDANGKKRLEKLFTPQPIEFPGNSKFSQKNVEFKQAKDSQVAQTSEMQKNLNLEDKDGVLETEDDANNVRLEAKLKAARKKDDSKTIFNESDFKGDDKKRLGFAKEFQQLLNDRNKKNINGEEATIDQEIFAELMEAYNKGTKEKLAGGLEKADAEKRATTDVTVSTTTKTNEPDPKTKKRKIALDDEIDSLLDE